MIIPWLWSRTSNSFLCIFDLRFYAPLYVFIGSTRKEPAEQKGWIPGTSASQVVPLPRWKVRRYTVWRGEKGAESLGGMVRGSSVLFKGSGGGDGLSKALYGILICPLSKKPLRSFPPSWRVENWFYVFISSSFSNKEKFPFCFRYCQDSQSLISDAIGVSFPVRLDLPSFCLLITIVII